MSKLASMNTPVFWAEGYPGHLDRATWQIEVKGLCTHPTVFDWNALHALPQTTVNGRLTSVTRWSVQGDWSGVSMEEILRAVDASPNVKYIRFWSYGKHYDTSIPISIAKMPKTILAWGFDGELLDEYYGGPVRLFCPYLWGYKSAKSVVMIELMDHYIPGFWEKRGYTDSGKIEAGPMRDINEGGTVKDIPDGEVLEFR